MGGITVVETAADVGTPEPEIEVEGTGKSISTVPPQSAAYHLRPFDAPGSPPATRSRSASSLDTPQKQLWLTE